VTPTPANLTDFLAELTLRNRHFIADDDQAKLARSVILIAGCGSTGGATVEPLIRAGAVKLLLAEPGEFELNNLNRQRGQLRCLGRNKGEWLAEQARAINPYVEIQVNPQGINSDNAADLAGRADVIVDAVDVTSVAGLSAKAALHDAAALARRPTISAYDLAYRQYVRIYDYRRHSTSLSGLSARVRSVKSPTEALALLVPVRAIPVDLVAEVERVLDNPGASISQLGCTADLFGALVVPLVIELLAERPVKASFVLDLQDAILPWHRRLRRGCTRWLGLIRAWLHMRKAAGK
jgi:molybdopterin/thiamine biosynthesis adenylyltransferase